MNKHIINYKPKDFLGKFNTEIIVVKNELLSPEEEIVQDIVSILHVFSCRVDGMRKYKKKIEGDKEIAKIIQSGVESDTGAKAKD